MSSAHNPSHGRSPRTRHSHNPPIAGAHLITQTAHFQDPHFPFQPLPPPNGPPPFRFDLSQLLAPDAIKAITDSGLLVFHTVGDTGDFRGQQQDFVAAMLSQDVEDLAADGKKPAFYYHLGDVVYFAGDVDKYGNNFYETYRQYDGLIVAIAGNHDCQPDDPQDGPVDPNKFPLDGWVQNFMSKDPTQPGSFKTGAMRTQMDLPNVFWTFTTPLVTIIGLFSNVGETQGEIHQDQIDWFQGELTASDPGLALIVTVHHPPFSGDTEHTGSSAVHEVLMDSFSATKRFPDLILSGHVHNYQRFTNEVKGPKGPVQIPCIVAGAGGYTKLGKLQKIRGNFPTVPLQLPSGLTLEQYDHDNFGFLRLEVSKTRIVGTYLSDRYVAGGEPAAKVVESFAIDLVKKTVQTLP
jgi:acid phosphatase type 7